jgi:hypothetical protein
MPISSDSMPDLQAPAEGSIGTRRPKDMGEYKEWLRVQHGEDVVTRYPAYYSTVVATMQRQLQASALWSTLLASRQAIDDEYRTLKGVGLLTADAPVLSTKPWPSFLDKTYRKNVVANASWPDPPAGGWVLPDNWFGRVSDLVRTSFYVKYLDGVEFLGRQIESIAAEQHCECNSSFQPGEQGYYAMHVDIASDFEIPRRDWDTVRLHTSFELQVTTGVKSLIKELLEERYRQTRSEWNREPVSTTPVAWMLGSEAFSLSYLGHVTHFIEELIVRLRDSKKEGNG